MRLHFGACPESFIWCIFYICMLGTEIAALLSLCRADVQAKPGSTQPAEQGLAEGIQHVQETPVHPRAIVGSFRTGGNGAKEWSGGCCGLALSWAQAGCSSSSIGRALSGLGLSFPDGRHGDSKKLGWLLVQGISLTQGSQPSAASLQCWAGVLLVVDNKIPSSSLRSRLVPVGQRPHFRLPRGEKIDP